MAQGYTNNILLGVNADKEYVVWNWQQENALAIIGKGGSGKTTSAIYWLSQLSAQGVSVMMCDPHMNHKESLYAQSDFMHGALIAPCVKSYSDIHSYVQAFHTIGMQRINDDSIEQTPLVLVIDEFTSYLINYPQAKETVLTLLDSVNQYRKVQMRLILIGQTWSQAVKMVSGLRDALSSSVILKSSANDARKFAAFETTAKEATNLVPGTAFYQDERLWIPRATSTWKLVVSQRVARYQYAPMSDMLGATETFSAAQGYNLYQNEHRLHDYASQS
jgi:hypothetical protein